MPENAMIIWRIETLMKVSDQIAAMMRLAFNSLVVMSANNMR
jgi:hypothetical protein